MPFVDFRCDMLVPLQDPAVTRLTDCGTDDDDVRFLKAASRQPGTQDLPLPWLQATLLETAVCTGA